MLFQNGEHFITFFPLGHYSRIIHANVSLCRVNLGASLSMEGVPRFGEKLRASWVLLGMHQ